MGAKDKILAKVDAAHAKLAQYPGSKGLVEGGLSFIPGIGTGITSALNTRANKLAEENSRRFAEDLKNEVDRLGEEKLDHAFIDSDEFVSVVIEALTKNARAHQREKVAFYARLFAGFCTADGSKVPFKEGFLQIIDQLSPDHIRAVRYVFEECQRGPEPGKSKAYVHPSKIAGHIRIPQTTTEAYCQHLVRFGLIQDALMGTFDHDHPEYEITPYGRDFARFLSD